MVRVASLLFFSVTVFLFFIRIQSNDQFDQFNARFINAYQQARIRVLKSIDPVVYATAESVTFVHRGQETVVSVIPRIYHNVKTISHVPFAIYLFLFDPSSSHRNVTSSELETLKSYLSELHRMRKLITISDFLSDEKLLRRQYNILDQSVDYLRSVIRSKYLNRTALKHFCHKAQRSFSENVALAARAQLDQLHATVYPWYQNVLNETERQTVQVVISGPKPPRDGFVTKQYFEKLLGGGSLEGKRILYAENVYESKAVSNLLAAWILDRHAAEAFFHDATRLHRDLLEKPAQSYINELFQ